MDKTIYLFKGEEELMIHNKINSLLKTIKVPAINKTTYDLEQTSLNEAINDCLMIPLMGDGKIVIIKNPHFLEKGKHEDEKKAIKNFIDYVKNPNDDCVLIIDATGIEIDEKSEAYLELIKKCEVSDTKALTEVEMKGWLKSHFVRKGIEIQSEAIDLFFNYVGTNLVKGEKEVEKLLNYINGKTLVTIEDIQNVVTDDGETDIYALTQAISLKNKALVHKKYNELIKNGYDQIQLLNLIYRSFKDLYTVACLLESGVNKNDIANRMGISSGRAYYLTKDAYSFGPNAIRENLKAITDLDYKIKTGAIDKATGMDLLLFGM